MHSRGSASLVIIRIHNNAAAAVLRVTNEACYCGFAYIRLNSSALILPRYLASRRASGARDSD